MKGGYKLEIENRGDKLTGAQSSLCKEREEYGELGIWRETSLDIFFWSEESAMSLGSFSRGNADLGRSAANGYNVIG
jgi:hypothetical protein